MNWESHLVSHQSKRKPLHTAISPAEFIDDESGMFVTKHGSPGVVVGVSPISFEPLTVLELDEIARRFEKTIRILDEEMRIYQYVFKRADPVIPTRIQDSPRIHFLNNRRLFSVEFFMALIYEAKQSRKGGEREINQQLRLDARHLSTAVESLQVSLEATLRLDVLDKDKTFMFLRGIGNYSREIAESKTIDRDNPDLPWQISDLPVECDPILKVGTYFVRALTMKTEPRRTYANMLKGLLEVPEECIICSEWKPEPPEKTEKKAAATQHHHDFVKSGGTSKGALTPPREHGGHRALANSISGLQEDIAMSETYMGKFSLTALIYSQNARTLNRSVAKVMSALSVHMGAFTEHIGKAAMAAWLACFPGNVRLGGCALQLRRKLISNENYADLSFLFSAWAGDPRNNYINDEYLAVVTNKLDQPCYLNLHSAGVGHTIITGKTETGKTFLLNFLIENSLKYNPLIFIFDILHGFRILTARLGGTYMQLGQSDGPGEPATINPFALEPKPENFNFLFTFIRFLLESDGAGSISNQDAIDLDSQIHKIYRATTAQRTLGNLNLAPHVAERLDRWVTRDRLDRPVKVGQYAYLFDNAHDSLTLSNFQTFNFPNMKKSPEAMEALLFYVIHWTSGMVEADPARLKFIVMDEALEFLRHPETKKYVQNGLQRWRHYNASMILSTQSLSHLEGAVAQAIFEQCSTRIFAANPGINLNAWASAFGMSEEQTSLISTLQPRRQFLLQDAGIFNLDVDPISKATYSNSPYTDVARDKAIAEFGLEKGLAEVAR